MTDRDTTPAVPPRRIGLSLCGGGLGSSLYQLGCLAALDDALGTGSCGEFDAYVGTAGGALLASCIAGGIGVQRLYRAMLDPADDFFPLERKHLVRFDGAEWRRLVATAVQSLRRAASNALLHPTRFDAWQELDGLLDSLPAGVSNLDALEQFLEQFFERRGVPRTFEAMPRPLYVPATDLDTASRVVFGDARHSHVPVARAVCASGAVPVLFSPVRIGERDYVGGTPETVANLDVLTDHGIDVAIVIHAMVPVHNDPHAMLIPTGHGPGRRVRDKGLFGVYGQARRIGLLQRLERECDAFTRDRPGALLVRIEPSPDDATMFLYPPMNFATRRTLLRIGYERTRAQLVTVAPDLVRAGIAVRA